AYDDMLGRALDVVRELGFEPTSRVKNTGTILEKLERQGGSWLKSIQDLAGMRVVLDGDRGTQDAAVAAIVRAFTDPGREPRVTDRRVQPSHGYRAVHVIAQLEGMPVEIQVRTRYQHEWADMFEKLADVIGRGIRYGEPPSRLAGELDPPSDLPPERVQALRHIRELAHKWHVALVGSAVALSDLIDGLERAEAGGASQNDPKLQEMWAEVQDGL
ncbi:hypothetical protein RNB18_50780, partial [Streptomyces sp. DSM 41640]|nr:hypothetical protein [Streptomyces sp. DSM 41640]